MYFTFIIKIAVFVLCTSQVSRAQDSESSFAWPEGKEMGLSLSFDDARLSNVDVGIPLFEKHNVQVIVAPLYLRPISHPFLLITYFFPHIIIPFPHHLLINSHSYHLSSYDTNISHSLFWFQMRMNVPQTSTDVNKNVRILLPAIYVNVAVDINSLIHTSVKVNRIMSYCKT